MQLAVRRAVPEDAAAIAAAHVRAWQVAYNDIVSADFLAALDTEQRTKNWYQNLTEASLAVGTTAPDNLVVEHDGQVVGFLCLGAWRDDPDKTDEAEIWAIYVHPDHWGAGAGHALMEAAGEQLAEQHVQTCYLWVLEENTQAKAFYERQGWIAEDVTATDTIGDATVEERRYRLELR